MVCSQTHWAKLICWQTGQLIEHPGIPQLWEVPGWLVGIGQEFLSKHWRVCTPSVQTDHSEQSHSELQVKGKQSAGQICGVSGGSSQVPLPQQGDGLSKQIVQPTFAC